MCLGPTPKIALAQTAQALGAGCGAAAVTPGAVYTTEKPVATGAPVAARDGTVHAETLQLLEGFAVVAGACKSGWTRDLRIALLRCNGAIILLVKETVASERCGLEHHLCIGTTAAGGKASLLASSSKGTAPYSDFIWVWPGSWESFAFPTSWLSADERTCASAAPIDRPVEIAGQKLDNHIPTGSWERTSPLLV